jgi:VWFA-related protein
VTFTPDRAQVARAIDTLGAPKLLQLARRDPLQFLIEDPGILSREASSDLDPDDAAIQRLRDSVIAHIQAIGNEMAKQEKSFQRGRISSWSRSMAELARFLDSVQGRKHVIYFSEGFDGRLLFGRQPAAEDADVQQDMENMMRGRSFLVDTDNIYGNTLLQGDIEQMIEQFRRADVVIQAVDIGGLRADLPAEERARSVGQDALFFVANETGGNLFQDASDFGGQLERVMERSAVTYLVSFRPETTAFDGAYHRLRVKVDAPVAARVSAREGYYAPRPWQQLHPIEKSLLASDAIASATPDRSVPVDVLAAAFKAGPGAAYVPLIVEVAGKELLAGHTGDALQVEFYAYATDAAGEMKDFFTQLVTLDLTTARDAFAASGLKYYGHLNLEAGDHLLRVLVRNAATGRAGLATVSLDVPAYVVAEPVLLPPFFVDNGRRWFMVREKAPQVERTVVYPFTVNGEPYVPSAHAQLARDDPAQVCLVAYNLGEETAVDGRVVAADGSVVGAAGLGEIERTVTGIDGLDKFLATFDPGGLAEGTYTLQVALTDSRTGAKQTNSIPFSVQ